jgi:hypothetical protein
MKHVHRNHFDLRRSRHTSNPESRMKAKLTQVSEALAELYELNERHGPPYYTKRYHDRAAAALRRVGKLQRSDS